MNNRKKLFNISIPLKTIINIWILIFLISIVNAQASTVLLKFNKTGSVKILGTDFSPEPNKVFVNGTQLDGYTNTINVVNITEVKLEWDSTLTSCKNMFKDLTDVIEIDLSNFNSNLVTDTSSMFQNCHELSSLNLNGFSTSSVTNMNSMFNTVRNLVRFDVNNFDTSNVQDFGNLFLSCHKMYSIDVSNFVTSKATNMAQMFRDCIVLTTLDFSNFETSLVTSMYGMFSFDRKLSSLNLSGLKTGKVVYFGYIFESCNSLTSIDVSHLDVSSAKFFMGMFQTNPSLQVVNLTNFRTVLAYDFENFFNGCSGLHTIIGLEYLDTHGVNKMANMFKNCQSLTSLDLSNFITSNVNSMTYMFYNCKSLTSVKLSTFNTAKVRNMAFMFYNCHSLTSLEIANFNTAKIIKIESMFYNCTSLTSLDITNFDTSNVISMNSMFEKCTGLTILNISNFYPSKCNEYIKMFSGCEKLRYVNFYNYYENASTIFTDIIKKAFNEIQLCIHVTRKARIYLSYGNHLVEKCLIPDETDKPTEEINQVSLSTDKQAEENINKSTNKETDNTSPEVDSSQSITNPDTTNKNSEYSSEINKNPIIPSTSISESKSTNSLPQIIHSIDTDNKRVESSNMISSDYIIINDFYLFPGYNNTQIYNRIIEFMLQSYLGNTNQKIYIKGENIFMFEITTEENEAELLSGRNINTHNTSMIDLGECKNLLKNRYYPNSDENINFIILKHETVTNKPEEKIVQYEVYDLFNKTKLDLSICRNVSVSVHIPTQLSESTQKLIESLTKLGYDVFNINDPFYTDFCTKYTTEEGTDISLADRKKYIYETIIKEVQCQENCEFSSYDSESRHLECSCRVQDNIETVDYKKFSWKKLHNTFYDVLKYSNYKVIFCYKLVFDTAIFGYNKGFWILFILFLLYLTQLTIYLFKKISPFKIYIARFHFNRKILNMIEDNKQSIDFQNKIVISTERNNIFSPNPNSQFPPKKQSSINNIDIIKNEKYKGKDSNDKLNIKLKENNSRNKGDLMVVSKKKISKFSSTNSEEMKENQIAENNIILLKNKIMDDFEFNNLEFEKALELDNRNFIRTYWSILKREHSIIFTFFNHNDYNLYYTKFARFIFLIATDLAMNVFFFSDETMNKLYLSYGEYDFVQQIPQIIYSKIITNVMEVFLCFLSLTDKHYYQIKVLSKSQKIKIFEIIKCVRVKIIIFFIFTFLIFLFYIYLVTAFCAIYEKTQIVYLKDSLSSFVLGLITPFIIYFFPCLFRLIALRSKCAKWKCMYSLSELIPIF